MLMGGNNIKKIIVISVVLCMALISCKKASSPTVPDNSPVAFVTKWGSQGSEDGQFNNPHGVAVDSAGNVYVADSSNNRIQKFTSSGVFITKWGSYGNADGQFSYPYGVAVDSAGNVYVADSGNNRVQKFAPQ
ncbi:MAG TPA: SBBP repeat-containing protein [Candidatus Goldiibacteriota bacterium]|nr:SBBP repeat-containing protein [Candidatus Goldiibacteriota bacterium]